MKRLLFGTMLALLAGGCAGGNGSAEDARAVQAQTGPLPSGGVAAAQEVPAAMAACACDADCVAVHAGCCHNGWMVAVNSKQQVAYRDALQCPRHRVICPHYRVRDAREPHCDVKAGRCVMRAPLASEPEQK
jgi:hypothetical protein